MDDATKVRYAHHPTNCCSRSGLAYEALYNESRTKRATPIASQYALGAAWATNE